MPRILRHPRPTRAEPDLYHGRVTREASGGRRRLALGAVLVCAALVSGCPESWRPAAKAPGSALWLGNHSQVLEASDLSRLVEAGVGEVYLNVAELDPAADDGPLVRLDGPDPPPSIPVTLVINGDWAEGSEPRDLAERVAESVRQLRFDAESRGGVPIGVHFDLAEVSSFETYGKFLQELRGELDRNLFLSTSLQRVWIDDPEVEKVADSVDFVVPFLYGQRVNEREDGKAWDFVELEIQLQKIESLGAPYMIGVVTLGTATQLAAGGGVKMRTTRLSLQEILWNRNLKLRPGFSLEGVNRRVYSVAAESTSQVRDWKVESGEQIRVVRAATSDIEELTRLVAAWEIPNHLGQVYYRLPSPEEQLSLTLENLLNALDPNPASPDLELGVSLQRRTGRGWLVRFSVSNLNGEITELSLVDSNYIQATTLNGELSARVGAGDFYRYELYRTSPSGEPRRDIRRPDMVRFHLPILEGRQELGSGDVEVKVQGSPELQVEGQFLLPDGRTVKVGPRIWRGGQFVDESEEAAEAGEEEGGDGELGG